MNINQSVNIDQVSVQKFQFDGGTRYELVFTGASMNQIIEFVSRSYPNVPAPTHFTYLANGRTAIAFYIYFGDE